MTTTEHLDLAGLRELLAGAMSPEPKPPRTKAERETWAIANYSIREKLFTAAPAPPLLEGK